MSKSVATLGLFAALMLGGCQPLEVDQVAQQSMIGLKARDIHACLGPPTHRAPAGQATEIWTYSGGQMRGYGPQWALLLNTNLPPFGGGGSCDVKLVMTNGAGQPGRVCRGSTARRCRSARNACSRSRLA